MARPLITVGVLADLEEGVGGGVNQVTQALVGALLSRPNEGIRYVLFLAEKSDIRNVEESEHVSVVHVRHKEFPQGWRKWQDRIVRNGRALSQAAIGNLIEARVTRNWRPRQQAILKAIGQSPWKLDIVHFPFQDFVPLKVPFIFSPWDLQHLHLKEFWTGERARSRDAYYRKGCQLARFVVLASEWASEDVIAHYGVPRSKTAVVRVASPTRLSAPATEDICAEVRERYALPPRFMFYPAATWKPKNHLGLLSALARADEGSTRDLWLVCSGQNGRNFEEIMERAEDVGVRDRVMFLGYVPGQEVRALYRLAEFCIYPSLFEGAGLPVLEAFEEGCPLAAADVTCIPEYAGDAALLFDPRDVDSIADAISRMASSESLRRDLVARGKRRARGYAWEKVADEFVSLYRRLANGNGKDASV